MLRSGIQRWLCLLILVLAASTSMRCTAIVPRRRSRAHRLTMASPTHQTPAESDSHWPALPAMLPDDALCYADTEPSGAATPSVACSGCAVAAHRGNSLRGLVHFNTPLYVALRALLI